MIKKLLAGAALLAIAATAHAQIKVGVVLSTTGPAASLGIPEKNTMTLYPTSVGGQKIEFLLLDDATDTTTARRHFEKLTSEDKVDVIIGTSTSPAALATLEVAANTRTPVIALAATGRLVLPMDDQKRWMFKTPYNDSITAEAAVQHMVKTGIKTLAFIGYAEAFGEGWLQETIKATEKLGVKLVATERFNPKDTSVTAQVLKAMSANPQAILIVGAGTPAALPHTTLVERGYKGKIYQTPGVINNDFLRVGGKALEGAVVVSGPVVVVQDLPDSNPAKKPGLEYKQKYEAAFGAGSTTTFGANAWDAMLILQRAIPEALKKAKPGSVEFRVALRDAIEGVRNLPATHGMINMSATDHNGFDANAPVMITITGGKWAVLK